MRIIHQQYRDALTGQRYPFDGNGDIPASNGFVVPQDLFLDIAVMVNVDVVEVFLETITVADGAAVATFALADDTIVATATFADADSTGQLSLIEPVTLAFAGYALVGSGAATIVSGWPAGVYTVHVPVLPHLLVVNDKAWRSGFELPDGSILTGNVYLVADRGLWLERTIDGFRLHVTGDPYLTRSSAAALRTINDVAPDANGNINLITEGAAPGQPYRLQIRPTLTGLVIGLIGGPS